jgi:hypothetical protein
MLLRGQLHYASLCTFREHSANLTVMKDVWRDVAVLSEFQRAYMKKPVPS